MPIYAAPPARPTFPSVIARTAEIGPRAVVLGGWAVFLAALAFGLASSGAVAIAAEAGSAPAAGATDGAGVLSLVRVAIAAPADGATFRVGEPIALHGDVSAKGLVTDGSILHWTVLRHTSAGTERVAEATGTDASFVPALGSVQGTRYEVRLTATFGDGSIAAAPVFLAQDQRDVVAPGPAVGFSPNVGDLTTQSGSRFAIADAVVVHRSAATGISGALRVDLPVVGIGERRDGARWVSGTLADVAAGTRVQIAVRRTNLAGGCDWWSPRAHGYLAGECGNPLYITAKLTHRAGTVRWRASLGGPLPAGERSTLVRLIDKHGRSVPFVRGS